jgi:hypothetical protein
MAAEEFRVQEQSRRDQLIAIGSSAFFLAVIAGTLWIRPQYRTPLIYTIAAAASLFLTWTLVRELQALSNRRNWPVVIDEHGVHYASPGQITWAEIASVEPVPELQRVDLRDAQGRVRVSIPYDLEDAHEVVQFVADMLADRWPEMPLPHDFSQKPSAPMLMVGAMLIVALAGAIYLMSGRPMVQLLCTGAMAVLLAGYAAWRLRSVRRLTVGKEGLTVVKGTKPRVLSYADVEGVGLSVMGGKAERHLNVKVTFRDKSATYVLPWRCDPFDVYATVKAAWARGSSAAAASAAPASTVAS